MLVELETSENTLLNDLKQRGIELETQCRNGYCGICRQKMIAGEVSYLEPPLANLGQHEVLICCARPTTKVVLDI
ncbi:class I ribonucleotide reductase maintenance protein YfaE [Enterovibrio norvegicus]|uniref:class I ribonucleotide reductase maintenance protein YfaE n=1 Tax=Enterovibrio norvegicus TaxID=188144 RepID=UPI000C84B936|nr:class I ribonucleotide reductase maintenance protein YfaE [Enterovibrio norvegicus]PMH64493.1 ferredoxin [Enterovibrio norvegicus]